jgi:four helix bundle protein
MTSDELLERLIDFAARVGKVVDALPDTRMGRHVAGQLVRSSTSPAPNYEEGCAAESRADFIHKLSICLKELRESRSWFASSSKLKCCLSTGWGICSMNAINSAISSGNQ